MKEEEKAFENPVIETFTRDELVEETAFTPVTLGSGQ